MGEFLVLIFVTSGRILKSGSAQLKQSRVFGIHCYQEDTTKRVMNLKEINFGRQNSSYAHFLVFDVSLCAIKKVSRT